VQIVRQLHLIGQLHRDGHRACGVPGVHLQLPTALLGEPITPSRVEVVAPHETAGTVQRQRQTRVHTLVMSTLAETCPAHLGRRVGDVVDLSGGQGVHARTLAEVVLHLVDPQGQVITRGQRDRPGVLTDGDTT
jgi:hypothetical protein